MNWFGLSILTLTFWGLWSFFLKMASRHLDSKSIIIYDVIGSIVVSVILLFMMEFKIDFNNKGVMFAILAGMAVGAGSLFFIYALTKGKSAIVMSLTALYPVVPILLAAIFLKEQITAKHVAGIVTAIIAFTLLAG